jgi:dTDP-4-dehydrorhamnose reductase
MKILVIGASGMLGNAIFRFLSRDQTLEVFGSIRGPLSSELFGKELQNNLISGVDVENIDSLVQMCNRVRPNVVINCVGLVKQLGSSNNPLQAIPINTLLPHRLAAVCESVQARLIHISTDCVFSGQKGNYLESDFPDAQDLYGRSKLLGEVDYPHAITLRTSIIGHELNGNKSLLEWFLHQSGTVRGFTNAIFSGLPTVELARVIKKFVLPNPALHGLYHVAAKPISKHDLLQLIVANYGKDIKIVPDSELKIDRSLNAERFQREAGYVAPEWPSLIKSMYESR